MKSNRATKTDNNCFHGVLLKKLAEPHVKRARGEKHDNDSDEDNVAHWIV